MKEIYDHLKGRLTVDSDTRLYGVVEGTVSVSSNAVFQVHGIVNGDLILKKPSTVYLNGIVNGNVINSGGHLEVFGVIKGKLIQESGETIVSPNSVIMDQT